MRCSFTAVCPPSGGTAALGLLLGLDKLWRGGEVRRVEGNVFRWELRVAYTHCTVGNHVYYARYLDMLEVARGEFFRAIGHAMQMLQDEGFIFPVIECSMRYRGAARYDDVLVIELWVKELDRLRIRIGHGIRRGGELLVEGETLHVCTNLQDRPTRIPAGLAEALGSYVRNGG